MAPVNRGYLGALLDRAFAWKSGLPPELCSYTVDRLRVPMADGVELLADLYHSQGLIAAGTLLIRTPYGCALPMALMNARLFAARGYVVLLSACRGTYGSGGQFDPG